MSPRGCCCCSVDDEDMMTSFWMIEALVCVITTWQDISGCLNDVKSAKLKHSNKQICIEPKLKWMQEYLEKYLQK
ncbi:hypothetical protein lerEdw1_013290 [Lerista edwardsae]|nr:hypothetical protein lerEdw1_013290 [Lerista edwardsae]